MSIDPFCVVLFSALAVGMLVSISKLLYNAGYRAGKEMERQGAISHEWDKCKLKRTHD